MLEKSFRNARDKVKLCISVTVGNYVADNIVFVRGVVCHHPEEPLIEIWEFI